MNKRNTIGYEAVRPVFTERFRALLHLPLFLLATVFVVSCDKDESTPAGADPVLVEALIIDHKCSDLSRIPERWLDSVRARFIVHYAHTSHGEQITEGLRRLAAVSPAHSVAIEYSVLPGAQDALRIFDGQENETYVTPDLYWDSVEGQRLTRDVLDNNISINISMWMWCTQLDDYNAVDAQRYLDAMASFEAAYPRVAFIYCTGNAQQSSANRHARNNQIREYCRVHKKVLFDFGDLDCWHGGQENKDGVVPVEHPNYRGDDAGHANFESCENKARAFWWMLARLAGWDGK